MLLASGSEWNRGIDEHRTFLTQKFATDPAVLRKALKRSEEDLTRWVTVQRFDPLGGAPGRELASTCAAIASWAMATTNSEDLSPAMLEQYAQLASHASDLAAILKSLSSVTRAQLELLLEQVAGKGTRCNGCAAKRDELTNNLQLQLAIYGYLIASSTAWPESAFFILKKRALLAQNGSFFRSAEIVPLVHCYRSGSRNLLKWFTHSSEEVIIFLQILEKTAFFQQQVKSLDLSSKSGGKPSSFSACHAPVSKESQGSGHQSTDDYTG
jgi:hypothetical protein